MQHLTCPPRTPAPSGAKMVAASPPGLPARTAPRAATLASAYADVAALAATRHGCVRTVEAVALGLGPADLRALLRSGRFVAVHDGVVLRAAAATSWRSSISAAVLAAGAGAAACGPTAQAVRLGTAAPSGLVHVAVVGVTRGALAGVCQHVVAALTPGDVVEVDGIAVVAAGRTLAVRSALSCDGLPAPPPLVLPEVLPEVRSEGITTGIGER